MKDFVNLLRKLVFFVRRSLSKLLCRHSRTFSFAPRDVYWQRDGNHVGVLTHGAEITGCMNCGKVWCSDYAE